MKAKHTPGPWKIAFFEYEPNEVFVQWPHGYAAVHGSRAGREANARLIAVAPDHALFSSALVAGKIRWEFFAGNAVHGEICVGGIRWATKLDEFGVPELTENTRAAIAKATGSAA
jgi:hypothetical protein